MTDDGRPSMSEALDALRRGPGGSMPAPDVSGPASLGELFKAFTPAGTDPDALMAALKNSQMPSVPLSDLGKAAQASKVMRWCHRCDRPEPDNMLCPAACQEFAGTPCAWCGRDVAEGEHYCMVSPSQAKAATDSPGEPPMPADPSPVDLMAGMAINDMIEAMVAGGRPLESAERIVGAMLAAHGIMAKDGDAR